MAKKRAARKTATSDHVSDDGKVAFQVRFDADLHGQLKELVEKADLSLNQLIQGMCRGLIEHAGAGRAVVNQDSGFISVRYESKCVYFGSPGEHNDMPEELWDAYHEQHGRYPEPFSKGWVWFGLDFSERGVVSYGK